MCRIGVDPRIWRDCRSFGHDIGHDADRDLSNSSALGPEGEGVGRAEDAVKNLGQNQRQIGQG